MSSITYFHERARRAEAEARLKLAEERLRAVVETALDAIVCADQSGNIVVFNRAAEEMFGYASCELLGAPLTTIMPERYRQAHRDGLARFLKSGERHAIGQVMEFSGLRADGVEFPIELSLTDSRVDDSIFFTAIIRDISQRKEAEEFQRRLLVLQEREDFIAVLAHDLKIPLIGANRLLELLASGKIGAVTQEQEKILWQLHDSNKAVLNLVHNLLDIYLYEKGAPPLSFEPIDLVRLASGCVDVAGSQARARQVNVRLKQLVEEARILADHAAITRLLYNLLDNSIKFTPAKGKVVVSVGLSESCATVEVFNTGSYVTEGEKADIFKRFWRGTEGKKLGTGNGLGLYLCKQIVDAHQGEISVKSQEGEGTIFKVVLPLLSGPA